MQQKLRTLQGNLPDELVSEVSKLYEMGLEPYEVEYIISQKTRLRN
jgi:hypothetical protein